MVPRWTGTVAGMVDPQSFAEMALLHQIRWFRREGKEGMRCRRNGNDRGGDGRGRHTSLMDAPWYGMTGACFYGDINFFCSQLWMQLRSGQARPGVGGECSECAVAVDRSTSSEFVPQSRRCAAPTSTALRRRSSRSDAAAPVSLSAAHFWR